MNFKDAAKITCSGLPGYDEIEDRRREEMETREDMRQERIDALAKQYFNDPGVFFEFIQNIEIGDSDNGFFEAMYDDLVAGLTWCNGIDLKALFLDYCQDRAKEDV